MLSVLGLWRANQVSVTAFGFVAACLFFTFSFLQVFNALIVFCGFTSLLTS